MAHAPLEASVVAAAAEPLPIAFHLVLEAVAPLAIEVQ
jgi:hypothetical protein